MEGFDLLTLNQKRGFLHTVFSYSYDAPSPGLFLVFYDAYTGKKRGTYNPSSYGLDLE